jgi:LPS export ABC transporter protein LptC
MNKKEGRKLIGKFWSNLLNTQLFILFISLFLVSCENDENEVRALNEKRIMVERAQNVVSLFSQEGRMKAKLSAPVMLRYEVDSIYIEFPKTLHVDFYDSTGQKESQLDALYAKYMESSNKVLLRDSVVVASVKGDTLRTSELWWDQNAHKFFTDKLVRLKTVDKTIYGGKGLEAEEDLSLWTIFETTGSLVVPQDIAP